MLSLSLSLSLPPALSTTFTGVVCTDKYDASLVAKERIFSQNQQVSGRREKRKERERERERDDDDDDDNRKSSTTGFWTLIFSLSFRLFSRRLGHLAIIIAYKSKLVSPRWKFNLQPTNIH